jgi:hypothetical protein
MKGAALFGEGDVAALRRSHEVLAPQTDAILDVWYGFVGSLPHLLASFSLEGRPDVAYLGAVRARFGQWILDTARAEYDQRWLDYQLEIGRRHHRVGKNRTDGAKASPIVELRYLFPLIVPVTHTLRPFLAADGASPEEVDARHAAWLKSVVLQVTLWAHPYVKEGDF